MSELIPFDFDSGSNQLPAHVRVADASDNSDLTSHATGFPVISIKGKVWAVVRDGNRTVLPNPKDPESAATSIEVVLLKANKATSKVFYLKGYDPAQGEALKPDCYSADGITPAADAQNRQASNCASCPHNQWGSKVSERGATKGKACQDTVRLAVAPNGQLNDPHLLRVPAASIRNLGEYGAMLAKRGAKYNMVVTKIAFDQDAESPKLTFKPIGFLGVDDAAIVQDTLQSGVIDSILDSARAGAAEQDAPVKAAAPAKPAAPAKAAEKPVEKVAAEPVATPTKPKATAKPKPEPAPVVEAQDDLDIELAGIDFDDE